VQGGEVIWQRKDVPTNEIAYPTDGPKLEPGVDYLLVVEDNNTGINSMEDPAKGLGFRVASSTQREALVAHCNAVDTLSNLDRAARNYTVALCYMMWEPENKERRPWGAAWLLLESVAETHDTPAVHLWRGDVLSVLKLSHEAEVAYQTALGRAEALGDIESQAAAHAELWRMTHDEVHWEEAVELYEQLGDETAQQGLEEER
jgi:hypothetical protein